MLSEGVVMQLASGEIVECNPAAERILGLTRDQMAGRTSLDPRWRAIHEDGSPFPGDTHPGMVTLRTGEAVRGVLMGVHRPDGSLRWISINSEPVPGSDGRPAAVVATFVDVTERRELEEARRKEAEERLRAEQALRQSERNLRGLFEAIDDSLFVLDGEGKILYVNPAATARLGWSREELLGRSVLEVHPEGRREEAARIVAAMVAGEADQCPVPLQTKEGKLIPVETRVFPGLWDEQAVLFGFSKDLSELRASEELFQKTFRNNPCPVVLRSLPSGRIVDVNEAFVETLGYRREDIVGQVSVGVGALVDAAANGGGGLRAFGTFRDLEAKVPTADGRLLHGIFSGEVLELQDGQLLLTVMKDVTRLREAEAELRQSRRLMAEAERIAGLGSFRWDVTTQKVVWSDGMFALFGIDRDAFDGDLLGVIRRRVHPDDVPSLLATAEAAQRDGTIPSVEFRVLLPDGTERVVWTQCEREPTDGGEAGILVGFVQDVTENRKLLGALHESEARFRLLAENSTDVIGSLGTDGVVRYASPSCLALTGYGQEEMIGLRVAGIFLPEDRPVVDRAMARHASGEEVVRVRYRIRRKDGRVVWVERTTRAIRGPAGEIGEYQFSVRDVSEEKKYEERLLEHQEALERTVAERTAKLRRSEERLHLAQRAARSGTWEWNLRTNEVFWTPELERLYGLEEGAFTGRWSAGEAFIHPEDLPVVTALLQKAAEERRDFQCEFRIVRADGETRWVEGFGKVVCDGAGQPLRMVGLNRDVTERKAAEDALRVSREEAQAGRARLEDAVRELDSYSYSISHELRSPIRAIDTYSALLSEHFEGLLDDEGRRLFEQLRWNARRTGRLLEDFLEFSRAGRSVLARQPVDMTVAARSAFVRMVPDAGTSARIAFSLGELPAARGDAAMLQRVWEILFSNAVKFSAPRVHPEIGVDGRVEGNEALYRVRDNGVGFDMKFVEKLFGVFQRLQGHHEYEGTGVGLALVKRIVVRHGGRVWAEGEVDRGAAFWFSLPAG